MFMQLKEYSKNNQEYPYIPALNGGELRTIG